ncbi:MAG: hypothetical protein AMXMBFR82_16690 [Candidatus Hydrogenedentota bacterium]
MTVSPTSENTPTPAVEVIDTHGRLPEFWPRDVTFFANLLSLFFGNEGGTASLRREVGEIDSYGGRLVPIVNLLFHNPGNILVLPREPDPNLCAYFQDDLGLSLPDMHVMTREEFLQFGESVARDDAETIELVRELAGHESRWVDGFVTDKTLVNIAQKLGKQTITSEEGSRCGNNKLKLHQFLEAHGLPVVDTCFAESAADIPACARDLADRGFRAAVVKAQVGASGIGMMKLEDIRKKIDASDIPAYLFHEGPCIVQGWLEPGCGGVEAICSPSVQIFVNETTVYLYDVTEQILSETSVHEGNVSPPPYLSVYPGVRDALFEQAGVAGRWLHEVGYRGTASADFLLVRYEGRHDPGVYICELNARVTGATYPSVIARKFLPEGAWLHRNLRLDAPLPGGALLAMFERGGYLYRPGKTRGVVPVNFNFGPDGLVHKGQFLCLAETCEACAEFLDIAQANTNVEWAVDRD